MVVLVVLLVVVSLVLVLNLLGVIKLPKEEVDMGESADSARLKEIEAWCENFTKSFNENTDTFNKQKETMTDEMIRFSEWSKEATGKINNLERRLGDAENISMENAGLVESVFTMVSENVEVKRVPRVLITNHVG
tara:strand:- start:3272 stop:3676 length:405 start_codon:yes stop_codon:yes gene_type:complete